MANAVAKCLPRQVMFLELLLKVRECQFIVPQEICGCVLEGGVDRVVFASFAWFGEGKESMFLEVESLRCPVVWPWRCGGGLAW